MNIPPVLEASQPISPTEVALAQPVLSSDFNTFLNMLTVQMKNQDPLNPMESSEFAVQLATFASVEQQVRTNDLLRDMSTQGNLGRYSVLVGKEVRIAGEFEHDGSPVILETPGSNDADSALLSISRRDGTVVLTQEISVAAGVIELDRNLEKGIYTAEIAFRQGRETLEEVPASVVFEVKEIRFDGTNPSLLLENGQIISNEDIRGIL